MKKYYVSFRVPACALLLFSVLFIAQLTGHSQKPPTKAERDQARTMLSDIKSDLQKYYYDPNLHGMNIEERFKQAEQKIDAAVSLAQLFGIVGQVLLDLNDSHTFFLPPGRTYTTDYGWSLKAIGDRVFATAIKPGSDAEAKGLKEGDEVHSIDGLALTRDNLWKIRYLYQAIRPRPGMRVAITKPDGKQEQLDLAAKVREGKKEINLTGSGQGYDMGDLIREAERAARLNRHRYYEVEDVFIWKMPEFDLERIKVDDMMNKVKKRKALVLDLRGNPGGYEETMLRFIGNLFDRDIQLGELKRRKETKPMIAKSRGTDAFAGKVVILIDSDSGSAAELLSRVVQLEKRGVILGDRSSGAVMRSRVYSHTLGVDIFIPYAVSVTDADIVMTDGQSLEHTGVMPDEVILPTAADMAAGRDIALARALSIAGLNISPEKAGTLFPIEWK